MRPGEKAGDALLSVRCRAGDAAWARIGSLVGDRRAETEAGRRLWNSLQGQVYAMVTTGVQSVIRLSLKGGLG